MPRTYTSDVRAERARASRDAVVAAATDSFLRRGWAGTTMADVASAAGLTRQTVYAGFEGKLALLDACIDAALSDGRYVAVRELPEYRAMADGDPMTRVAAAARWLRGAHERSAAIQHVLDEAAVMDPVAATRLAERERTRWDEVRWAGGLVLGVPPADHMTDALWILASRSVWLRLTGERSWTGDRWEAWFARQTADTLEVR
ncbi:TetR family transcriptional regulator [Rhodococcus sp. Leaf7]|uniref:TetR/AcrR family transcriptional regulator n=1 Tax=unclassified Rhodococcus (in: high G+C Gram-positive bacteria) TaxID=192944 RepID=UPI000700FF3B|nr:MULTISPECIES: TetR/AcrR family transcriptional regulator [unclassified Rhodococcus (in: high G+C Gram-positive bacteria)]KQU03150.1 TetR family transcriptional regulator [Rhodococcus sp. Leaf7]KQU38950.1 TetR family transcriptional regulator [Rhodococcus sp. Leaf247]